MSNVVGVSPRVLVVPVDVDGLVGGDPGAFLGPIDSRLEEKKETEQSDWLLLSASYQGEARERSGEM